MALRQFIAGAFALVAVYAAKPASVEELAPSNFNEKVLNNSLPVVVEFYADWCASCRHMRPIFEDVCKELKGKAFCGGYDVEQDEREGPSFTYDARDVPTYGFFCKGKHDKERSFTGGTTRSILKYRIEELIKSCK